LRRLPKQLRWLNRLELAGVFFLTKNLTDPLIQLGSAREIAAVFVAHHKRARHVLPDTIAASAWFVRSRME